LLNWILCHSSTRHNFHTVDKYNTLYAADNGQTFLLLLYTKHRKTTHKTLHQQVDFHFTTENNKIFSLT